MNLTSVPLFRASLHEVDLIRLLLARKHTLSWFLVRNMKRTTMEEKALRMLQAFEHAGKKVRRVSVEGRRIELDLSSSEESDEFDGVDMRHGETRTS